MKFSDMDMIQDYEKDARMAMIAYTLIESEVMDGILRKIIHQCAQGAAESQERAANLIVARGDRP
ncbi:MAG: hypothetical protein ACYC2T_11765 [Bacillota bacterium]